MSNIPFDRPLCGPMRFEPNAVPPVQLNLPPALQQLVPVVASHLLNRAMEQSSTNPARLCAMNHLVVNNFQNENYPAMVELALRLAVRSAFQQNNPGAAQRFIGEGVDQALMLLSSSLLATIPQLQQMCDARTIQAAYQNNALFQKIKSELGSLNLSVFQQQQQQVQNPAMNNSTTAPLFTNYSHSYAAAHQQDLNPAAQTFGSQWGGQAAPAPQQTQVASNPLNQNEWFSNNEHSRQAGAVQQAAIPVVEYQQAVAPVAAVILPLSENTPVTCNGENEMDINNHALPYFGSHELLLDLSIRHSDLKLESLQLAKEGRRLETSTDPVLLEPQVFMEANLDTAIFSATVSKSHNLHGGRQNKVYRQFLHILSPVSCSEEAILAQGIFQRAQNLGQVPDMFRSFLKAIKDPTNPQENEELALNFYAFLDNKLTESVNDFLKYNLRVGTKLDSFSEDFGTLPEYLRGKFGENKAYALQAWASRFFDQLRLGYNQEAEEFLVSFFESQSKASIGYYPTFQSITLLGLTQKELGYKVEPDGSLVDPKVTGLLDSLTQGLFRNKKDRGIQTSKDWIVTADDIRYRVAEDAMNPGKFYLYSV